MIERLSASAGRRFSFGSVWRVVFLCSLHNFAPPILLISPIYKLFFFRYYIV